MKTSDSIKNIAAALLAAQAEMPHPKRTATNPHLRNKFADLTNIMDTTKPILCKHGLVIMQSIGGSLSASGQAVATCTTRIAHAPSGEYQEDTQVMVCEPQKGLNLPQVFGVSYTYMKRYGWGTACGINSEPDDDGNESTGGDDRPRKPANPASDLDL